MMSSVKRFWVTGSGQKQNFINRKTAELGDIDTYLKIEIFSLQHVPLSVLVGFLGCGFGRWLAPTSPQTQTRYKKKTFVNCLWKKRNLEVECF